MDDYEIGTWFYSTKSERMMQYIGETKSTRQFSCWIPWLLIWLTIEVTKKSFNPKMLILYIWQEHILYGKN